MELEDTRAFFRDMDHKLPADSAPVRIVQTRLNSDDHACLKFARRIGTDAWRFVGFQPDAVSQRMRKAGFHRMRGKAVSGDFVDICNGHAGADTLNGFVLRFLDVFACPGETIGNFVPDPESPGLVGTIIFEPASAVD